MIRLQCIRTIIVVSVLSFLPAWVHAQGGLQFAAPRVLDQFTLDRDRYWGCAAGDINDDSLIDFIVTNGFNDRWSPGEVQVSLGRQGGGFNTLPPQFEDLRPARPLLEDL
ncbi:MAG: hypothetical protein NXI07_09765, partial [bacterium]|nr:hypothetical protein [bacterium]